MRQEKGTAGNLMSTGLCVLAMTMVMLAYMGNIQLIGQKMAVSQAARKYILKMEAAGYLEPADRTALLQELTDLGATQVDLSGTTMNRAGYGGPVCIHIQGKLGEIYEFEEKRVSTAKN